jgi:hypothetical protein
MIQKKSHKVYLLLQKPTLNIEYFYTNYVLDSKTQTPCVAQG